MGPIVLDWVFLEECLELITLEVVLERTKGFSVGKQDWNAILDTTVGLESFMAHGQGIRQSRGRRR